MNYLEWLECIRKDFKDADKERDRWKNRSRTYTGIAAAMAEQWGM